MILNNYTPKIFVENFIKDSNVFGQETTQAIYEEVFSAIYGKKIKLGTFVEELEEMIDEEELLEAGMVAPADMQTAAAAAEHAKQVALASGKANGWSMTSLANVMNKEAAKFMPKTDRNYFNGLKNEIIANSDAAAKKAFNQSMAQQAANQATGQVGGGLLAKIGGFLKSLPGKVKAFFGGLKGKSFSEIMNQGMAWLQANPMLALKTTGGIALLGLLIRALKKRGELNKYNQLAAIASRAETLKEDCYDTMIEDTKEKEAMRKVLEECKTNKALAKVILG